MFRFLKNNTLSSLLTLFGDDEQFEPVLEKLITTESSIILTTESGEQLTTET